ncbi:Fpg/Nei family DNA glycosylase [Agromyces atrinae]|uniref:Formamidopyrimidine-DNA glycosylase n=1 Tax=Agromyces atrinae TaxID=592376 RepID=A0A4Q2M775_9MICO|nr:DNA-formamidopyrimidine glycosylase family protein [Agromyces atrinae]NYD65509.1 formamidopyrimidine-DNA glycosylase [Agromyces atrinae]RXZ85761.1 Fpg/Nei family DNA glycosylase [Agromyces atrinae]
MPELPEVEALVGYLDGRMRGLTVARVQLASYAALKTVDPSLDSLVGEPVRGVSRHGKFIDIAIGDAHLVVHLARAGWLRWSDAVSSAVIKPGRSPIALRVVLSDGSGFDLTEAGSKKSLSISVVRAPRDLPGVARLGPNPLDPAFTRADFGRALAGRRTQIKGLLRDQSVFAGIGNAYSDEILHAAHLSPFAIAATLPEATVDELFAALRSTLERAIAEASGRPPAELKDAKRARLAVHGRTGEACPVCGDTVREVRFADSSLQYCPTCQTGGKVLADRVLSRLLK